jgi:glycine/D-amino acid oxidase-like deaminating enzyme
MEITELSSTTHTPARVAVVGAGNVGSTFAYTLLLSGLASEIVLIDANRARAEGEAMDISHALPFTPSARVWAGDYADCADAAITVITAGAAQKPVKRASIWRRRMRPSFSRSFRRPLRATVCCWSRPIQLMC